MLALIHPDQPASPASLAWQSLVLLAGSAINQDGRSGSLTAPNGPSQQEAMNAALRSGDLAAWQIAHLQMHGTGGLRRSALRAMQAPPDAMLSHLAQAALTPPLQAPRWATPSKWARRPRCC